MERGELSQDQLLAKDEGPLAEEVLERKQQRELLDRILRSMTSELSEVLMLYEIEDLTMLEIAVALDIPEGTAASRLRRARAEFGRKFRQLSARPARRWEEP